MASKFKKETRNKVIKAIRQYRAENPEAALEGIAEHLNAIGIASPSGEWKRSNMGNFIRYHSLDKPQKRGPYKKSGERQALNPIDDTMDIITIIAASNLTTRAKLSAISRLTKEVT